MKILNIILVVFIGISCYNNKGDDLPRLLRSIPIDTVQDIPNTFADFEIHIQSLFEDDKVIIEIDDKVLFDEAVTTDHLASLAHILHIEIDRGDHVITVKMDDKSITEIFTFNGEMVIAVKYRWMEDELDLVYFEDGERPLYL